METPKGFFQFEIVRSFRFIRIPMLWVYGHYHFFYYYSVGIHIRCQITVWGSTLDVRLQCGDRL